MVLRALVCATCVRRQCNKARALLSLFVLHGARPIIIVIFSDDKSVLDYPQYHGNFCYVISSSRAHTLAPDRMDQSSVCVELQASGLMQEQ